MQQNIPNAKEVDVRKFPVLTRLAGVGVMLFIHHCPLRTESVAREVR